MIKIAIEKLHIRLKNSKGESLAETMLSMLIVSLAFLVLSGGVITAARLCSKADNTASSFSTDGETDLSGSFSVSVTVGEGAEKTVSGVKAYKTKNGYIYFYK